MTVHQVLVSRDLGGAGLIALQLAEELKRRSQAVKVWIPGGGPADREARAMGLEVVHYAPGLLSSDRSRWQTVRGNLPCFRELRRSGRGLVHVHAPHAYRALFPALAAARLPCVVHVHIEESPESLRWAFRRLPHRIITCANYIADHVRSSLSALHGGRLRITAVPNAVDMGRFSPGDKQEARRRVGAPADLPLVVMLANLAPHKGQETAIRAVSILRRMGTPAILWLAGIERGGTGEFTRKLQGLIGELGLENCVDLLGQRDDAQELLRASDAFLLPSTNEGLPLSILEAQATGVPVFAAPTAGVPEIIADGRNGFLIPADDAQGYADRIRMLLENPGRSRLLTEEALRGIKHRHAWSTYAQQILDLYASVMGGPTRLHSQSPRPAGAADLRP